MAVMTLCHFESYEASDHRELGAMKVAEGTQAFMFETSLQLAVTKVIAQSHAEFKAAVERGMNN